MKVKLEKGHWGSNVETLGISEYRGFHVVVTDEHGSSTPQDGQRCLVGIYEVEGDDPSAYELTHSAELAFDSSKIDQQVEEMVERILA